MEKMPRNGGNSRLSSTKKLLILALAVGCVGTMCYFWHLRSTNTQLAGQVKSEMWRRSEEARRVEAMSGHLKSCEEENERSKQMIKLKETQQQQMKDSLDSLQKNVDGVKSELAQAGENNKQREAEIIGYKNEATSLSDQLTRCNDEKDQKDEEIDQRRKEIDQQKVQNEQLIQNKDCTSESHSAIQEERRKIANLILKTVGYEVVNKLLVAGVFDQADGISMSQPTNPAAQPKDLRVIQPSISEKSPNAGGLVDGHHQPEGVRAMNQDGAPDAQTGVSSSVHTSQPQSSLDVPAQPQQGGINIPPAIPSKIEDHAANTADTKPADTQPDGAKPDPNQPQQIAAPQNLADNYKPSGDAVHNMLDTIKDELDANLKGKVKDTQDLRHMGGGIGDEKPMMSGSKMGQGHVPANPDADDEEEESEPPVPANPNVGNDAAFHGANTQLMFENKDSNREQIDVAIDNSELDKRKQKLHGGRFKDFEDENDDDPSLMDKLDVNAEKSDPNGNYKDFFGRGNEAEDNDEDEDGEEEEDDEDFEDREDVEDDGA